MLPINQLVTLIFNAKSSSLTEAVGEFLIPLFGIHVSLKLTKEIRVTHQAKLITLLMF